MSELPFSNLTEAVGHWAKELPDKIAWAFLDDRGIVSDSITYKGLDDATTALADQILTHFGISQGDRVLLVFFPGLDFTITVLACFKAGVIAVPVFPPDPRKLEKDLHHFVSIQSNCGAKAALCNQKYNHLKKIAGIKHFFSTKGHNWPELSWIQVDRVVDRFKGKYTSPHQNARKSGIVGPCLHGEEIAFLQYTSGSTSEPKGVMISHSNLAHNETLIQRALLTDTLTVNLSWLPQYHDMGLIGSYLGAVWCGASGYYLSPMSFLKDPLVWVRAMSVFRATHTQAPNFAFALTSRKYREYLGSKSRTENEKWEKNLDLSLMQHMINAAEPVDMNALLDFYQDFSPFGLRPGVIVPTFGLAEHCVYVCSCEPRHFADRLTNSEHTTCCHSSGVRYVSCKKTPLEFGVVELLSDDTDVNEVSVRTLVSCGNPSFSAGVTLIIVDPVALTVEEEGKVGEIWINSASKACGYWGNPEISLQEFHAIPSNNKKLPCSLSDLVEVSSPTSHETREMSAYINCSSNEEGYLRTGDLGFLWSGELFICGRLKDLIIIRGSNHYPQDIERSVESTLPLLRTGCTAAFSCCDSYGNGESLVFIAEVREAVDTDQSEEICRKIRASVASEHGITLTSVCLLKPRTIPKTTSGKIARSWCRRAYLSNPVGLDVLFRWDALLAPEKDALPNIVDYRKDEIHDNEIEMSVSQTNAYSRVPPLDPEKGRDPDEIRRMSSSGLQQELELVLCDIVSRVGGDLKPPVDGRQPLVLLGMDSMSIIQFKGVLDNRYKCSIPDEYMFTKLATLESLVQSVQFGGLSADQLAAFEAEEAACGDNEAGTSNSRVDYSVPVVGRSEPWCPWFSCCY